MCSSAPNPKDVEAAEPMLPNTVEAEDLDEYDKTHLNHQPIPNVNKKPEMSAKKLRLWLQKAFLANLQWMDSLTKNGRVWGLDVFYMWCSKGELKEASPRCKKDFMMIEGPEKGRMTVLTRICLDWAMPKEYPNSPLSFLKLLFMFPATCVDKGDKPIDVIRKTLPEDIMTHTEWVQLDEYIYKNQHKVGFIFFGFEAMTKEQQTNFLETMHDLHSDVVTIITNESETRAVRTSVGKDEIFSMGIFDENAKKSYVEKYYSVQDHRNFVLVSLFSTIDHESVLTYMTNDPDSLSLLCFYIDCSILNSKTLPRDQIKDISKSLTDLLHQITLQILSSNSAKYELGTKMKASSLKALSGQTIYYYLLKIGQNAYNYTGNIHPLNFDSGEFNNVSQRMPINIGSGSFKEIDNFLAAFWVTQTDSYKDKDICRHMYEQPQIAVYACGLVGDRTTDMLDYILASTGLSGLFLTCQQEATDRHQTCNKFIADIYKQTLRSKKFDINITLTSLRGTKALLDLISHDVKGEVWKSENVSLNVKSSATVLNKMSHTEEDVIKKMLKKDSIKHANEILPSSVILLRLACYTANQVSLVLVNKKELQIVLNDVVCDHMFMERLAVPVKEMSLKMTDCVLKEDTKRLINIYYADNLQCLALQICLKETSTGKIKWHHPKTALKSRRPISKLVLSTEHGNKNILGIFDDDFSDSLEYLSIVGNELFRGNHATLHKNLKKVRKLKCALICLEKSGLHSKDMAVLAGISQKHVQLIGLICSGSDSIPHDNGNMSLPSLVSENRLDTLDDPEPEGSLTDITYTAFKKVNVSHKDDVNLAHVVTDIIEALPKENAFFIWCKDDIKNLVRDMGFSVEP